MGSISLSLSFVDWADKHVESGKLWTLVQLHWYIYCFGLLWMGIWANQPCFFHPFCFALLCRHRSDITNPWNHHNPYSKWSNKSSSPLCLLRSSSCMFPSGFPLIIAPPTALGFLLLVYHRHYVSSPSATTPPSTLKSRSTRSSTSK